MVLTITTYTGAHFAPTEPDANEMRIEDIAHALSLLCRGNGHVKQFFSVGQHCLHCAREALARGLGSRMALVCLLHDASEAYLSDVPRPFKASLPQYKVLEEELLALIYEKYLGSPLTPEEEKALKQIDDEMLYYDLKVLLHDAPEGPAPAMKSEFFYEVLPFEQVEREYKELFFELEEKYHTEVVG